MNLDITSQAIALNQMQSQTSAQFLLIKKQQEMDKMLIETMQAVPESPPAPPGTGTKVDKSA